MTSALRGPLVAVTAAALAFTANGVAHAAPAVKAPADVTVDLSADPSVVGSGDGTTITATVHNQGDRPARNVGLKITVPSAFELFGISSSSALPCTLAGQVVTCTATTDLAAHATEYPVTLSLQATAPPGTHADFDASVTTKSAESNTANNAASRTVQIVGVGTVQGNVWNDLNGDGQREPGKPALNDITGIRVINPDDGEGPGVSNIFDGHYSFWDVRATRNIVRVTLDGSGPWTFTTPNVGDDATDSDISNVSQTGSVITGDSADFNVTAGGVVTIDVGLVAKPQ
jgi:hypothetical protein